MGLFSNKKKTVVNTTVQPVFEEAQIPDSVTNGMIKGILADEDVVSYMLEELAGSIGVRAARGYNWAKNNDYAAGIPVAQVNSTVSARGIVLSTIASEVGQAITADYYKFGPMNSIHYGWTWLMVNAGYNPQTNELTGLSAQRGFPCYLTDMRATYPQEDYDFIQLTNDYEMLAQWGPAPSSGYTPTKPYNRLGGMGQYAAQSFYTVSPDATEDFITVTYEFVNAAGVIEKTDIIVPVDSQLGSDYHQVRYMRADGAYGFWSYAEGARLYPAIDGAYTMDFNNLGTYLPWCYFRHHGQRVVEVYPDQYKHYKKWVKYLGVDFDSIDTGVHEDPDVDDVEQALLIFGVNPSAQSHAELHYLFEYFSVLYFNSISQSEIADNLAEKFGAFSNSPTQVQYIQDKIFKMAFQYSGIVKKRVPGKIAAVGKYTGALLPSVDGGTGIGLQPAYVYRKQTMDSSYEEVAVFGLRVAYQVTDKKAFSAGAGQPELLVPVDRVIMNSLSMRNKEQLLTRSLYMVVNTAIQIKTPWYASSVFKIIMVIVAIVITILSAGTAWATIVAALSVGYVALAIVVLSYIISALAINYAVKLFVKEFGPQVGFIAAIAAMAYGAYSGAGMTGSSTWGETMLTVGSNLAKTATSVQQDMLADLQQEMLDFQAYSQGMFDSLKEKRDQLGLNPEFQGLSGLDIVNLSPIQVWGESPNDFYTRTVHSGNIGATSFDVASGFVNYMLKLPDIQSLPQPEASSNGVPD